MTQSDVNNERLQKDHIVAIILTSNTCHLIFCLTCFRCIVLVLLQNSFTINLIKLVDSRTKRATELRNKLWTSGGASRIVCCGYIVVGQYTRVSSVLVRAPDSSVNHTSL